MVLHRYSVHTKFRGNLPTGSAYEMWNIAWELLSMLSFYKEGELAKNNLENFAYILL
jgi:hypothetical protein